MLSTSLAHVSRHGCLAGYFAMLLWLPLPLGSATTWGWLFITVCLMLLAATAIRQDHSQALKILATNRWFMYGWALLCSWHLILLIPLPEMLIEWLRPRRILVNFTEANDWLALTYSTSATFVSLLRTLSFWALFTLTLLLMGTAARLKLLLRGLVAMGLFQTLYSALMLFLDTPRSLILDLPIPAGASGTFLRPEDFAFSLFISLCAVLALLVMRIKPADVRTLRHRLRRIVMYFFSKKAALRIATLLLLVGIVLSGHYVSVWVTAAATLATGLAGYCLFSPRPTLYRTFVVSLAGAVAVALVVTSFLAQRPAAVITPDIVTQEEAQWAYTTPDATEHWLLGAGPGTAKEGHTYTTGLPVPGVLPIAQQDLRQFMSEFGVVMLAMLAAMVLVALGTALKAMQQRQHVVFRSAAFMCTSVLTGTVLHAFYAAPLQSPANAAYVSVMLALSLVCLQCRNSSRTASV
ncbi:hypothetical protein IT774_13305 [Salinimonas marina]|uniref:O-antigen ligase domain-containing protein n=1 Tax=Salinimonas marina TaxID=2785918 RepID=A0A7S9DWE9_9ALTE|nr:hypothetical protein [Salinimonas marina]QPG05100.1 hypothetical protein IT774_13305 [Salinimonas marina]